MPLLRVLFVSNLYPPNSVGGYERLCCEVATEFAVRGHAVTVLTSVYGQTVSRHSGQIVHQALRLLTGKTVYDSFTGTRQLHDAINTANITAMSHVVAMANPDVIFCWNLYGLDRSFLDAMAATGVRLVVMLTDNWLLGMYNPGFLADYFRDHVFNTAQVSKPVAGPVTARTRFPFSAIFGAEFMREFYADGGLSFDRPAVIYNGVRQAAHPEDAFRDRIRLVQDGQVKLLFAGRIVDVKGVHTAVEALPMINDRLGSSRRCVLTIVGDVQASDYLDRLRAMAQRLGVSAQVEFQPPVDAAELFGLFQEHDIYLFPSIYEPFALTLILAMAAGIPTAATRVGGNTEIIRDGSSGLLFEKNDPAGLAQAVTSLANDPRLRVRIAQEGRDSASYFTFTRMVDEMERFLLDGQRMGGRHAAGVKEHARG
jgi:glycosyltransferase involved in cell wall biosynthesis